MIEALATVIGWQRGQITLTWQSQSTCGHCEQSDDCGTGIVARALAPKENRLELPCNTPYTPGTRLRLGIAEQDLLGASALVYLLPLLGLVLGAVGGQLLWQSEPATILFGIGGGVLGFWLARRRARDFRHRVSILGEVGQGIDADTNC